MRNDPLFWNNVEKSDSCWVWVGCRFKSHTHPYGMWTVNGRPTGAHRVAWEAKRGAIPQGLLILHRCDNPPCVNPDHLFLGTQSDNIKDCVAKGRHPRGAFKLLTKEQVLSAREWYAQRGRARSRADSTAEYAAKLGVERKTLSDAIHGKTWKHLPNSQPQLRKPSRK